VRNLSSDWPDHLDGRERGVDRQQKVFGDHRKGMIRQGDRVQTNYRMSDMLPLQTLLAI